MSPSNKDLMFEIQWEGRDRMYEVHRPAGFSGEKGFPVVLVLHGAGGNAAYARRMSEMNRKADEEKFIVVYPNGSGLYKHAALTWNAYQCCGYAHQWNVDDVGFLSEVIDRVISAFGADPARVYMTGISNGAMMAHRMACERSKKIAAIAPVAGVLNDHSFPPAFPVSVMLFHGTADQHAPYDGGLGAKTLYPRQDFSVRQTVDFWVRHNGCRIPGETNEKDGIIKETYSGGLQQSEVIAYTIKEGGHAWPGGKPGMQNGNVDEPTQKIKATDLIWDFFKIHSKRPT